MKGQQPDFECFAVGEILNSDKKSWTQIGVAFVNKDSISIKLKAYPVRPELVLLKPKPKEEVKSENKMLVFK